DGVMLSLLYNQTIGGSTGYQGSLFSNIAGGDFHGMQGSIGVNYSKGDFVGLQLSPVFNGTAGTMKGLQVSLFNFAGADLMIGQIGGVNVAAGEGGYVQLGAYNLSKRSIRGLQAGLLNVGKNVAGLQVGLVNYSEDHDGVQLGIVNVSKRLNGIPIGIVDIQFNGENHIDFVVQSGGSSFEGMTEKLYATTYFRFGSRYFYKYFDFGLHGPQAEATDGYPAFIAGAGLGLRIPALFEGFAIHADAGANYHSPVSRLELVEDPDFPHKIVPQFRLFASCKLFRNAGILVGLENWIYTKHFHDFPSDATDFEILTEYGLLMVDSRLFVGVQL
ncbi:MAG: hypothetical protein Q8M76_13450, partial [Spirochaetaceae bacterium]|nr:hypothetical protein [Spirochaetaceae bacterium]